MPFTTCAPRSNIGSACSHCGSFPASQGAGRHRWNSGGETHPIGPVPCGCLQQFVSAPFFLERTRLQYMRGFVTRCVDLPSNVTLEQFIQAPDANDARRWWRRFSFAAAHDALRLGAEPSLHGTALDPEQPKLGELMASVFESARGRKQHDALRAKCPECARVVPPDVLRPSIPPLLQLHRASALPLAPLSACVGGCGPMGWCEWPSGRSEPAGRCGCFVPRGLDSARAGGAHCDDVAVWRTDQQPSAHWGPPCLLNCSGHGLCDWHGFCR
jgi:hypothetical protein